MFIPPIPDFVAWISALARPPVRFASVDYAGLGAKFLTDNGGPSLGTATSGNVSERPLADGRAEVSVELHTTRALTWVVPFPSDIANDPTLFGYRANEILADPSLRPALSTSHLFVTFKNTAPGAPLPDLVDAFILGNTAPGQELVKLSFRSSGNGTLHSTFGVDEGTPGQCTVSQTGLFMTHFQGATADGFPAEYVRLNTVGRGTIGN